MVNTAGLGVVAFLVLVLVGCGLRALHLRSEAKERQLAILATHRQEQIWRYNDWHFRTYGWVPQQAPVQQGDDGWWFIAWI